MEYLAQEATVPVRVARPWLGFKEFEGWSFLLLDDVFMEYNGISKAAYRPLAHVAIWSSSCAVRGCSCGSCGAESGYK